MKSVHLVLWVGAFATAAFQPGLTFAQTTNWVAYNDHERGTATAPNVSTYSITTTAGATVGGPLTNFNNGSELSVGVAITPEGSTLNGAAGTSADPNAGTPADLLFGGKVDFLNSAYYFDASPGNATVTITFTNLDPSKTYVFRGTVVRGNNYATRWTLATITGVNSATPAHITGAGSPGIITNGWSPYGDNLVLDRQAAWNCGENRVGDVLGWDEIVPEGDSFSVVCENWTEPTPGGAGNTTYCYAINAFMLAEVDSVTTPLTIVEQPIVSTNLIEGQTLSLSVRVQGSAPQYQWYHDNSPILGANARNYIVPRAKIGDSGEYYVVVSGPLNSVTSNPNTAVTVDPDLSKPVPINAVGLADMVTISLNFSEPVEQDGAENPFSYEITGDGGAFVSTTSCTLNNETNVLITTEARTPGVNYVVRILDMSVFDLAAARNPVTAPSNTVPLTIQVQVMALEDTWKYDNSATDRGTAWRAPGYDDSGWSSGPAPIDAKRPTRTVVSGYNVGTVLPEPVDPDHPTRYFRSTFFIPASASGLSGLSIRTFVDDACVVYLNGQEAFRLGMPNGDPFFDTLAGRPAVGDANFEGPFVLPTTNLVAGTNSIAVEIHQAALSSSDATWGAEILADIDQFASGSVVITSQPQGGTVAEGQAFTLSVAADGALPLSYQWYHNNNLIPGANAPFYDIAAAHPVEHGGTYRVDVSNPQGTVSSADAVLTVTPDGTRPVVLSAVGNLGRDSILVSFSEPVAAGSAEDLGHYTVVGPGTVTILGAVLTDGTNVTLTTSTRPANTTFRLRVNGVTDLAETPNTILTDSEVLIEQTIELISISTHLWKYLETTNQAGLPPEWVQPGYDDSSWLTGYGIFYGSRTNNETPINPVPFDWPDGGQVYTVLNVWTNAGNVLQIITYYFRTTFNFPAETNGVSLLLHSVIDDGAIFYLNGERLYDVRLTNNPVYYTDFSNADGGQNWEPPLADPATVIGLTGLKAGQNTLAVEVHQTSITSHDVNLGVLLEATATSFVAGAPGLSYAYDAQAGTLTFSWTAPGYVLESAPDVSGPWNTVSTTSPATVSTATGTQFFRLRQ